LTDSPASAPDSPATAAAGARRVCVIGGGIGGLALAVRLQAAGREVVLVEARPQLGGWASAIERDGFTFDGGPAVIADPAAWRALWGAAGQDMSNDIELLAVTPACRYHWPDGTHFDLSGDPRSLRNEIARLSPIDITGFADFLIQCSQATTGEPTLASPPELRPRRIAGFARHLARDQHWRSAYGLAAQHVESEQLRQALTVMLVLRGANPMAPGTARLLAHSPGSLHDLWYPRGGMQCLISALGRLFERIGGTIRLHDPVVRLHMVGNRVTEVETCSGWRDRFDAVASNADTIHTYRDLLGKDVRGEKKARRIARRQFSPAMFTVHFALEGSWPGIPHRMVLFGPRYGELLSDIFEHGVLPQDMLIYLSHPSVTDPSLAPEGRSTFQAAIPVAHLGKLAVDWDQVGPMLERRILREVGRRLVPDIEDRIITSFHRTPRDGALDFSAHLGSAFGLGPLMTQSDWLRPHIRDDVLANFYLVGAGTFPGAGVPNVLASARLAAGVMERDLG